MSAPAGQFLPPSCPQLDLESTEGPFENGPSPCMFRVELRGFEPLTPSMRTRCATGLRYSPENTVSLANSAACSRHWCRRLASCLPGGCQVLRFPSAVAVGSGGSRVLSPADLAGLRRRGPAPGRV